MRIVCPRSPCWASIVLGLRLRFFIKQDELSFFHSTLRLNEVTSVEQSERECGAGLTELESHISLGSVCCVQLSLTARVVLLA